MKATKQPIKEPSKVVSARVSAAVEKKLQRIATRKNRKLAFVINEILTNHVN